MNLYRLQIKAIVCLSLEAATEQEAIAKAKEITEELGDGLDLDLNIDARADPGERLYFADDEPDDIEVVNVESVEA